MKKILIFIIVLIAGFLIFSFALGKYETIQDGQVGILVGPTGNYKIYRTGEKPFVLPVFQKLYSLSVTNQDFILSGSDGFKVSNNGENIVINSRIIYSITDVKKTIDNFGTENTHKKIRNDIRQTVNTLLREKVKDKSSLETPQKRIPIIAEIHLGLNDRFYPKGVKILSYQIRYQ
jgi:regulator of protease activity HflC (stomatin/prohibitin superfamily)